MANKLYLNIETTTKGRNKTYDVFINNGSRENYFTDDFSSESQVKTAIEQVEPNKKSDNCTKK